MLSSYETKTLLILEKVKVCLNQPLSKVYVFLTFFQSFLIPKHQQSHIEGWDGAKKWFPFF